MLTASVAPLVSPLGSSGGLVGMNPDGGDGGVITVSDEISCVPPPVAGKKKLKLRPFAPVMLIETVQYHEPFCAIAELSVASNETLNEPVASSGEEIETGGKT